MIKEALEYIVGMKKPELMEVKGEQYTDKELYRVSHNPKAQEIELHTLTSLIDYISSKTDKLDDKMILHVVSSKKVILYSQMDDDREREYIANVNAELPYYEFGRYMEHEAFCIALQSEFVENEDRKRLLQFAGTVESGSVAQYSDDGVSQKATVRTGIASKGDAIVPSPVKLRPYRTFLNLEQPESEFIFRMREGHGGVECAIFEADGGAWRDEARERIHEYLKGELLKLKASNQFIVIS